MLIMHYIANITKWKYNAVRILPQLSLCTDSESVNFGLSHFQLLLLYRNFGCCNTLCRLNVWRRNSEFSSLPTFRQNKRLCIWKLIWSNALLNWREFQLAQMFFIIDYNIAAGCTYFAFLGEMRHWF